MSNLRHCSRCGNEYPATLEYFYHVSPRTRKDELSSWCKHCVSEAGKLSRSKHADKAKVRAKKYAVEHREQVNANAREYVKRNPEKRKETMRAYSETHREQEREKKRRWRANNPEKHRAEKERRRAWKLNAEGEYTADDIKAQYSRQKGKCYWCNVKLNNKYHVDHIVPLSRGGSNRPDNIVCACPHCNDSRGAKLPHEWVQGGKLL